MGLLRRKWTPESAEQWTREDWIVILISPLAYVGIAVGTALVFFMTTIGLIVLGITMLFIILMHWIIDPKLKTISREYERKQKQYLIELEQTQRWEEVQ